MEQYQEYLGKLQKRGSKPHKLSHCLGSRDAFHWVRKNKWKAIGGKPVDKLLYSQIISEVHKVLADAFLEGHEIEFPYQMGTLVLTSVPAKVFYKDGELKTNYRIDWKKTLDYRFNEDPDGHKLIRRVQPLVYGIKYYKKKARFHNRKFYFFRANRSLTRAVGIAAEGRRLNAETVNGYRYDDIFMNGQERRSIRDI